jgi:hypothetical protein
MRCQLHRECPIIHLKELRKKLFILAGTSPRSNHIPRKCKPDFGLSYVQVLLLESALKSLNFST